MKTTLLPTLFNDDTTSTYIIAELSTSAGVVPSFHILATKLPKGWHNTEKCGDIFISPGGIAWVVQRSGDQLESVSIKLSKDDIIKEPVVDRVKRNLADRQRRSSKVVNVSASILTASGISEDNDMVAKVLK